MPRKAKLNRVGELLEAERVRLGLSVEGLARRLGKSRRTLHRIMYTEPPPLGAEEVRQLLQAAEGAPRTMNERPAEPYGARTTLTRRLAHAPRALAVAAGYLHRLEEAGVPSETVEEAERLMLDGTYNKLHARDPRQRTEDDLVTDIEAAWAFIALVLREQGVQL